jgi:hypothetical protein
MQGMFSGCTSLKEIPWEIDMKSCINCNDMFASCGQLTNVKLKNVPRVLDISGIGLTSDKYTIVNKI